MMGIVVKPCPPPPLQVGALYDFKLKNAKGEKLVESQWRGWVRKEYERFYLVENVRGFYTTVHKYSVGTEWTVTRA